MKCRPTFFLTNFPSNELYIQIDVVFHALSEYDFEKKKKNEENTQKVKTLEKEQKSHKNGQVFPDYDQQKIALRQNQYDIRNQDPKLHPVA